VLIAMCFVLTFTFFTYLALVFVWVKQMSVPLNYWMLFNSWLVTFIYAMFSVLSFGSLFFLLSALLRKNAYLKSVFGFLVLFLAASFAAEFLHIKWLDVSTWMRNLFLPANHAFISNIQKMAIQITALEHPAHGIIRQVITIPDHLLSTMWHSFFSWIVALRLALIALFFTLATIIFKNRQIDF
jgi:signal transduction histidine kinase